MDMDLDKFNYECQGQISMFDLTMPMISITNKIRLIELFAGYGSQSMALDEMGVDYEHYKVVEFDKYAIQSYNAVHGTCFEPSDIRDIRGKDLEILYTDLFTYLLTYSFPCTDLSVAGKMQGMSKGSGTRSGLLWEVERLLTEIHDDGGELPQILFMENVPQVLSSANIKDFHAWQDFLTGLGYTNHVQILNAKDYGVAQNRERAFMFSFLGEFNYKFPEPIPLTKTMKDYLEDEVEEKYYINSEKAQKLIKTLIADCRIAQKSEVGLSVIGSLNPEKECQDRVRVFGTDGISPGLRATDYKDPTKICVDLSIKNPSENNVANCITSRENRGISNQQSVGNGVIVAMRGRNPQNPSDRTTGAPTEQRLEPNAQGICNAITTVQKDNMVLESAILTPKRTDYGKEIRKSYESGVVKESRHNMTELVPRTDGITNTLTTVQKDNMVLEKCGYVDVYNQRSLKDGICGTITANGNTSSTHCGTFGVVETIKIDHIGIGHHPFSKKQEFNGYGDIAPCLIATDYKAPKTCMEKESTVRIKQATKDGYIDCKIGGVADLSFPTSETRRGRVQDNGDTCPTITAGETEICRIESRYRIRKLTPKECFRLMGVNETDIEKIMSVNSNSQCYKQAGNSIVVNCMIAMFSNLNIQGLPRWDVIKQRYI